MKPTWLLTMMCSVPPTRYAAQPREVERLGHHALAGERRVAVDADRQHEPLVATVLATGHPLVGARHPRHHRVHELEMARIRRELQLDRRRRRPSARARSRGGTSRRPCCCRRSSRPAAPRTRRTSRRSFPITWVSTLRRPRCAMPDHDLSRAALRAPRDRLVEHRDQHVRPLDREPLVPQVGALRNRSSPSTSVSRRSRRCFSSALSGRVSAPSSIVATEPGPLLLVAEVRELEADRAAVHARAAAHDVRRRSRSSKPSALAPARRRGPAR